MKYQYNQGDMIQWRDGWADNGVKGTYLGVITGVFEDRKLYDRILKIKCDIKKPILDDFNKLAYTGYAFMKNWSLNYEPSSFKLEAWSKLIDEVLDDNDPLKDKFKPQQS